MDTLIALALASLLYPLTVLLVVITGPHNETEKRELAERRAALRSRAESGKGDKA